MNTSSTQRAMQPASIIEPSLMVSPGSRQHLSLVEQLRAWRIRERILQAEAAAILGITLSHWWALEEGGEKPSPEVTQRLQKLLTPKAAHGKSGP
ncbi:MAG: helix-turn-helix transcriptional regulator [Magnetococcales bacterium]|nr:helix-turn-helix transcriptional regulator [Magnetococcales bacterium]